MSMYESNDLPIILVEPSWCGHHYHQVNHHGLFNLINTMSSKIKWNQKAWKNVYKQITVVTVNTMIKLVVMSLSRTLILNSLRLFIYLTWSFTNISVANSEHLKLLKAIEIVTSKLWRLITIVTIDVKHLKIFSASKNSNNLTNNQTNNGYNL